MFPHAVRLALALVIATFFAGCGGGGSSASPPAGGLTLVASDGQIVVSWNDDSNVQYDLWYSSNADVAACQNANGAFPAGCQFHIQVTSPYVITGLVNGVSYYFVMNARKNGGPAGDDTPIASATPTLAGDTWQPGGAMGSADMHGIVYGTNVQNAVSSYVAVGNAGAIYNSTNGTSWTPVSSPTGNNLNAAAYAQNNFIAAGAAGSIFYSPDALTWTAAPSNTAQTLNALGNNAGLAKCYGILVGTVSQTDYFTSPSTCGFSGSRGNNASLTVAVGDSGTVLYSSNGGVAWTTATSPTANNLYGVAFSAGVTKWVAVGAGGTMISSTDGINWTTVTSPTTSDLFSIAVLASTNAATLGTTYTFVAVGAGGTILTSNDGVTWVSQTVSPAANLHAVTGWSRFVAVGDGGAAFTSADGTTWTSVASGTTSTLYGVLGAYGQYNAVGQGGASVYSK